MIKIFDDRISPTPLYFTFTPNELRTQCGLDPINRDETSVVPKITNCVNCAAPIDLSLDHCEYCGTNYALMGIQTARRNADEIESLRLECDLISTKMLYEDVLEAMRRYDRY